MAIKRIKRTFATWAACVGLREASSLRRLSHPHVVPLLEVIRERCVWAPRGTARPALFDASTPVVLTPRPLPARSDSSLCFVFEYVPGGSLHALTQACAAERRAGRPDRRLTPARVRSFVGQVLSALAYVHGRGYVHRDIKPENILVHGDTVKVRDVAGGGGAEANGV